MHPDPPERATMRAALGASGLLEVVGLTGSRDEGLAIAHRLRPAVTLLDDRIPPPGPDLVHTLAQWSRVIALTSATEHHAIIALLRTPVQGCLVYGHFEQPDLARAVHAVADGLSWLSPTAVAAVSWALRRPAEQVRPTRTRRGSSHLELP